MEPTVFKEFRLNFWIARSRFRRWLVDEANYLLSLVRIPVLIYQMGKVASSSIFRTLEDAGLQVIHLHSLSTKRPGKPLRAKATRGLRSLDDRYRSYLSKVIRERRRRIRIITLVRDPISQNYSSFFQNLPRQDGEVASEASDCPFEIDDLIRRYRKNYPKTSAINYFDTEFLPSTNIDVYSYPFPHRQGWQIIESGPVSLLLMRVDAPDSAKLDALNRFLGTDLKTILQENVSSDKLYADSYEEFKRRLRLPSAVVEELVDSKYSCHYFTEKERTALKDRWIEGETR